MYRKLGEIFYIDFVTHNPITGGAYDATTVTGYVYEDNNDIAVYTPVVTKRAGTTGRYYVTIDTSNAAFRTAHSYNTVVSVVVSGVTAQSNLNAFYILNSNTDTNSGQIASIPTNPLLTNDSRLTSYLNYLTFISGQVPTATNLLATSLQALTILGYEYSISGNVILIPLNPLLTNDSRLNNIDATISSRASQSTVDAIQTETDKIQYILGLSQSNFRIFPTTYDGNGHLTASEIKIYPTAVDCTNNTNALKTYYMTASYTGDVMNSYKVTE